MARKAALLSIAETAVIIGASPKTVRRHIADGTLPARRIGRLIRIHPDDLEAALHPIPAVKAG